jgi:hypothetical protein
MAPAGMMVVVRKLGGHGGVLRGAACLGVLLQYNIARRPWQHCVERTWAGEPHYLKGPAGHGVRIDPTPTLSSGGVARGSSVPPGRDHSHAGTTQLAVLTLTEIGPWEGEQRWQRRTLHSPTRCGGVNSHFISIQARFAKHSLRMLGVPVGC